MDKILSIQTIKNVFAALGAKTSDSNYGVALLDKTSAEPKGIMGMSDLASVLGGILSLDTKNNVDCDTVVDTCAMVLGNNTSNCPVGDWSYLICIKIATNCAIQINIHNGSNDTIYYRKKMQNGAWNSWYKITMEYVS